MTEPKAREEIAPSDDIGSTTVAEAASPPPVAKKRRSKGGRLRLLLAIVVIAGAAALAAPWLADRWSHVLIDDSRIAANMISISSEASGTITEVAVSAGDTVEKGQLLVSIDRERALLELEALDAEITGIEAQQSELQAKQEMIRTQVARKLEAARAEVRAAEANHEASEAALQNAQSRHERVSTLASSNIASQRELEESEAALAAAEQEERAAAAGVETATANLAVTKSEEAQIAVLDRQIASLEAQKSVTLTRKEQQRIDLQRREIHAEFDGVVDTVSVDAGEYVAPGTRLLVYHDPDTVWVDANVKETSFGQVELGAPATITVDAYPDAQFSGEVVSLGRAATSQFALLPSPNPSGNFTKVTQRLPLRISIEQQDGMLRPGMMVEVSIDVVD